MVRIAFSSPVPIKIAAVEEALIKFESDIHISSTVVPVQLDITDDASIKAAHSFIAEFLKTRNLNVLINNAGLPTGTFQDIYKVNLFGTVALTEAIRPLLAKGGAILNISSELGKSALNALTAIWQRRKKRRALGSVLFPSAQKAERGKVIAKVALKKEGRTAIFFSKDGDLAW